MVTKGPPLSSESYMIHLRGLGMKNKEPGLFGLGRSDPFYELSKITPEDKWDVIHRSNHIQNHLNPFWEAMYLPIHEIDEDTRLRIQVFDHNRKHEHTLIGEFETTFSEMQSRKSIKGNADTTKDRVYILKRQDKDERKSFGSVCVLEATVIYKLEKKEEVVGENETMNMLHCCYRMMYYSCISVCLIITLVVLYFINESLVEEDISFDEDGFSTINATDDLFNVTDGDGNNMTDGRFLLQEYPW